MSACCEHSRRRSDLTHLLHKKGLARDLALCRALRSGNDDLLREHSILNLAASAHPILEAAATKHSEVRRALLAEWPNAAEQPHGFRRYPGVALEGLVAEGDEEASRVYCQWLEQNGGLFSRPETAYDPRILECSLVQETARRLIAQTLQKIDVGTVGPDGKRTRISLGLASLWLGLTQKLWERDTVVVTSLIVWLRAEDSNDYRGALACLDGAKLSKQASTDAVDEVVRKTEAFRAGDSRRYKFEAQYALRWLARNGHDGGPAVDDLFSDAAHDDTSLAVTALAHLVADCTDAEAKRLSEAVAPRAVVYDEEAMNDVELEVLVACAPDAWAEALELLSSRTLFLSPSTFVRVLRALPPGLRVETARRIYPRVSEWDVPWSLDGQRLPLGRPADLIKMLMYDEGVDLRDLH